MVEYISKDALITEIERLQDSIKATAIDDRISKEQAEAYKVCVKLRSFIEDTLEVKEMDLEKEFDNYTKDILACDIQFEPFTHLHNCAKYFYKLGLKSKGE